jgi:hypothetical protein
LLTVNCSKFWHSVERKQPIHSNPSLLRSTNVVTKEAACAAVSRFIKMARKHDYALLGCRCHCRFGIVTIWSVLVTFGIIDSGGDVSEKQFIVFVMLNDIAIPLYI